MSRRERAPEVSFKMADHFVGPLEYGSAGAAAIDLRLPVDLVLFPEEVQSIYTGLFLDMSEVPNMAALILPRSGLGSRGLEIANTVGLIDSDYQGEIIVKLRNSQAWKLKGYNTADDEVFNLKKGERFVQMVFLPILTPKLTAVDQFESLTARGKGGFGSTGTK